MKLDEINLPLLKSGKAGIIPYIKEDGVVKMLFMKSSDARYGGPDPMISKGHVDEGESFAEAALREGEEELGLKQSNCDGSHWIAWKGELSGYDARYPFHVFAAEVKDKEDFGKPHYETESTHWLSAEEFAQKGRKSQNAIVQSVAKAIETKP
jgi:8-oxo-dGTP pyrophosphatase MutT (NUDIX family)